MTLIGLAKQFEAQWSQPILSLVEPTSRSDAWIQDRRTKLVALAIIPCACVQGNEYTIDTIHPS